MNLLHLKKDKLILKLVIIPSYSYKTNKASKNNKRKSLFPTLGGVGGLSNENTGGAEYRRCVHGSATLNVKAQLPETLFRILISHSCCQLGLINTCGTTTCEHDEPSTEDRSVRWGSD